MRSPYAELKERVWEANMEIPARGLALYTWGNVSALAEGGDVFAIKPSGVPYPDLKPEDMVVQDLEGRVVEGRLKPSSDTPTHRYLYREFSGLGAIVHTHSTHACAWAQAARAIPLYGTTHADHLARDIPCTGYLDGASIAQDYEWATGRLIVDHFRQEGLDPTQVSMVLVAGHGPFAWGSDPAKAVYHAAVLEEVARMAWITESINPQARRLPEDLVRKHFERKHGPTAYYGQG